VTTDIALQSDQLTKIGIIATIALVVIGLLLSVVITAIVGRLIVLLVVVGLAVLVWQQRANIQNHINKCQLNMSFVGVHVDAPPSVVQKCQQAHKVTS
jgi:protein-S-isoprenylcysteine O-methyltransferase Ste14